MKLLTITTPDVENGLGCRVTIWVSGCGHHCVGCQNPHTWSYDQGVNLTDDVKKKIYDEVSKKYIEGITLSGGDPLCQSDESLNELISFLDEFKQKFPNKDIWIYSGYSYEELIKHPIKKEVLNRCDVLIDGEFKKNLYDPDLAFRGSYNQRIIDLKASNGLNIIELNL